MSEDRPRIQSYVADQWYVSTVWRQSSAMFAGDRYYYETLVWRWDSERRERRELIHEAEGLDTHFDICQKLLKGGEEALEDERE